MDVSTNQLYDLAQTDDLEEELSSRLKELSAGVHPDAEDSLRPVPNELEHAARTALRGRSEVAVSKNSGGKLSQWAKKRRRAQRRI